jgi:hypothetical protein
VIVQDQAKQRLEQDPWVETIAQKMAAFTEATIRDAFKECFQDLAENHISTGLNRRMSKCLLLAGWVKDGKFNSGSRRNQVRFTNPSQVRHRQTTVQISDFQPLWIYRL